jgi:hypothetical protein
MLLAEVQPTVSLDRLSPKVIVREQTKAPWRHELALGLRLYLHVVYILYMYILFVWGERGEVSERRLGGRSPRA